MLKLTQNTEVLKAKDIISKKKKPINLTATERQFQKPSPFTWQQPEMTGPA